MDPSVKIPVCPPPWDAPNDIIPMLVVLGVFLLAGWFIRLLKARRQAKKRRS